MKALNYLGPFSVVSVGGEEEQTVKKKILGGKSVELPDDVADRLLKDSPESWELAETTETPTPAEPEEE